HRRTRPPRSQAKILIVVRAPIATHLSDMNPLFQDAVRHFCACLLSLATGLLIGCSTSRYALPQPEPAGATPATGTTPVSVAAPDAHQDTATNSPGADWVSPGNKITVTFCGIPNRPPKYEDKVREDGYTKHAVLTRPRMA